MTVKYGTHEVGHEVQLLEPETEDQPHGRWENHTIGGVTDEGDIIVGEGDHRPPFMARPAASKDFPVYHTMIWKFGKSYDLYMNPTFNRGPAQVFLRFRNPLTGTEVVYPVTLALSDDLTCNATVKFPGHAEVEKTFQCTPSCENPNCGPRGAGEVSRTIGAITAALSDGVSRGIKSGLSPNDALASTLKEVEEGFASVTAGFVRRLLGEGEGEQRGGLVMVGSVEELQGLLGGNRGRPRTRRLS